MTSKLKMDIEAVKDFIRNESNNSKVYIGCDSLTFKKAGKWYADYVTVVVIHRNGNNGCKIFGQLETELDFIKDKTKPILRLMNEAIKTAALYGQLKDAIGSRYREIHLDINPDEKYNSHLALSQAVGYIRGMCGIEPHVKPEAFAASYAADRYMRVKNYDLTKADDAKTAKMIEHNTKRSKKAKAKKLKRKVA